MLLPPARSPRAGAAHAARRKTRPRPHLLAERRVCGEGVDTLESAASARWRNWEREWECEWNWDGDADVEEESERKRDVNMHSEGARSPSPWSSSSTPFAHLIRDCVQALDRLDRHEHAVSVWHFSFLFLRLDARFLR